MADEQDKASKTEEPTEKRLKEAHEEGNFAKAEEIQVVFGLCASFIMILFYADVVGASMFRLMRDLFANLNEYDLSAPLVVNSAMNGGGNFILVLMPVFVISVLASILAGGLQSGFKLAPKALKIKGSKLSPIKNAQQKFGKPAYVKFGVDLLKLCSVAGVIAFAIRRVTQHPIFYTSLDAVQVLGFIKESTLFMLSLLIAGVGFIALINYLYQKQKVMGDLLMTKQEVRDEHKQQEGDQQVKNSRRQLAHKLMERQMFAAIPSADVVVTNPTHYAVALRYDKSQDSAPLILAKGKNLIAQRIKQIAREHGVPMVEDRPAAQALYKIGEPGKQIPSHLFQVVAEIIAYAYRTNRGFFHQRKTAVKH